MNFRIVFLFAVVAPIAFARQVQFRYDFKHVAVTPALEKQLREHADSLDHGQHLVLTNPDSNNVFCVLDDGIVQSMREYCELIDVQSPNVEYHVAILPSKSLSDHPMVEPFEAIPQEAKTIGFSAVTMNASFERKDGLGGVETVVRLTPKGTADRYDSMVLSVETTGHPALNLSLKPTAALVRNVDYLGQHVDLYVTTRLVDTRGSPWHASAK